MNAIGRNLGNKVGNILGNGFGRSGSRNGTIPFKADLALNFDTRVGSQLVDSVSGETADILLPCFYDSDSSGAQLRGVVGRADELLLDGNSYTLYFKFKNIRASSGVNDVLFIFGGGTLAARRGMTLSVSTDTLMLYIADGTTRLQSTLHGTGFEAAITNNGIFECIININFTTKILTANLYNEAGNIIGNNTSINFSTLVINSNNNYQYWCYISKFYTVQGLKKYLGIKTIAECRDNANISDIRIYVPIANEWGGMDISGNANNFIGTLTNSSDKSYQKINTYSFDYGVEFNRISSDVTSEYIHPKTILGAAIDHLISSATVFSANGNTSKLNMFRDCKIRFTNAFFDRSNATIWNDSARLGYYDASHVKDFHITELNQKTLYDWLNDGYRGKVYLHMLPNSTFISNSTSLSTGGQVYMRDANLLNSIYLYTNDKKTTENQKILKYTNDLIPAVLSGITPTFDTENYVKLGSLQSTKPMIVFRIDDGYVDAYTTWEPLLSSYGFKASMNIHSQLVGTSPTPFNFMTWAQIKELVAKGWEITSSGMYDNDWNTEGSNDTDTEYEVLTSKQEIEAQGITCNHLIPNKWGMLRPSTRYFGKKHGYKTVHVGNVLGSIHGTNPKNVDLFNLCAMACDLTSTANYNVNVADPTTAIANIKTQIDTTKSDNRFAILYVHAATAYAIAGMTTIFDYIESEGIDVVTMDEALTFLKYQ